MLRQGCYGLQGFAGLVALQTLTLDLEGCSKLRSPMQRQFDSKDELLNALGCGGRARTLRVKVRLKRRSAKRKLAKSCAIQ